MRYISPVLLLPLLFFGCGTKPTPQQAAEAIDEEITKSEVVKEVVSEPASFSSEGMDGHFQQIKSMPLPQELTFAGEKVPLDRAQVREALEYELYANCFRHSRTAIVLKRLARWKPMIDSTLNQNEVPADFLYLAIAESELDNTVGSPVGARGMWQFMKGTGKDYGLTVNSYVDERRDPVKSTKAACKFLKKAYEKFESWTLVCAAYNMGPGALQQRVKDQEVENYYDLHLFKETSRYVFRILAFKLIMENPETYGFYIQEDQKYAPLEFDVVEVKETIPSLVTWAKEHGTTYKELRQYNPWFNNSSSYKLQVPRGGSYEIWVPK